MAIRNDPYCVLNDLDVSAYILGAWRGSLVRLVVFWDTATIHLHNPKLRKVEKLPFSVYEDAEGMNMMQWAMDRVYNS